MIINLLSLLGALALFLYGMKIMSVERYEAITDRMEVEIADYLHKVSEGRLSAASKAQIQKMLTQISELESVGDSCYNLGRTLNRKLKHQAEPYTPEQHQHILTMLGLGKNNDYEDKPLRR